MPRACSPRCFFTTCLGCLAHLPTTKNVFSMLIKSAGLCPAAFWFFSSGAGTEQEPALFSQHFRRLWGTQYPGNVWGTTGLNQHFSNLGHWMLCWKSHIENFYILYFVFNKFSNIKTSWIICMIISYPNTTRLPLKVYNRVVLLTLSQTKEPLLRSRPDLNIHTKVKLEWYLFIHSGRTQKKEKNRFLT